jgi:hypothetical protein
MDIREKGAMREYMLLVFNLADSKDKWPKGVHTEFVRKCESYISLLQKTGNMIAAQPMARQGRILSGKVGDWNVKDCAREGEVQVGYYHLRANSLDDAVELAKGNPEFEYSSTARIEIRPIKSEEADTGFVYPTGKS